MSLKGVATFKYIYLNLRTEAALLLTIFNNSWLVKMESHGRHELLDKLCQYTLQLSFYNLATLTFL